MMTNIWCYEQWSTWIYIVTYSMNIFVFFLSHFRLQSTASVCGAGYVSLWSTCALLQINMLHLMRLIHSIYGKKKIQIHFVETKQILAGAGYSIRNWFVMNASESMTRDGPRTTCVHQVGQYFNAFVASAGRCLGFHPFPSTWNDSSN